MLHIQVQGQTFLSPILLAQLATLLHPDTPSALGQVRVLDHRQKPESPVSHSLCLSAPARVFTPVRGAESELYRASG